MSDWIARSGVDALHSKQIFMSLRPAKSTDQCLIDLSHSGWVGPGMMSSLAAFVDYQHRAGKELKFTPPLNRDVANYLSRMGLPEILESYEVDHGLPNVRANMSLSNKTLVEVTRFSSEDEVADLVGLINYRKVNEELQRVVSRALAEAGCNVPEHAKVKHGFAAAQVTDRGRTLRFAVADCGVGIFHTLRSKNVTTEPEALRLAIEGTSETGIRHRGRGLSGIKSALAEHGGGGALISGNSMITMEGKRIKSHEGLRANFPGTILDGRLALRDS